MRMYVYIFKGKSCAVSIGHSWSQNSPCRSEDGPSGSGECSCMAGAEAGQRCSDAKLIDIWLSKYSDSTSKHGRSYIILFDLVFEWLMMGELISFCVVLMGLVWVSGLTNKFGDVNRYAAITCNGMK